MLIGILSDTHNELDSRIAGLFSGVDEIFHAGDIGNQDILSELQMIAPVVAVPGNTDSPFCLGLSHWNRSLQRNGTCILLCHGHQLPVPIEFEWLHYTRQYQPIPDILIHGHTNLPFLQQSEGRLIINPGSSSRPKGGFPSSVGLLELTDNGPRVKILSLTGEELFQV